MSAALFSPVNQIRHTNVSVVRLKKGGKRFEVACYKNKVLVWRSKVEKDINEVLQSQKVFTNVSKGEFAKKEDLIKAFGTDDELQVCLKILDEGEFQVSDKEREALYENMFREIAAIVTRKCINPDTKRPYTIGAIERAMRDLHFAVKLNKNTKQQALEVIRLLQKTIPIERAQMRLRITLDPKAARQFKKKILKETETGEKDMKEEYKEGKTTIDFLIDPGMYREVDEFSLENDGTLEVLDACVIEEGDKKLTDQKDDERDASSKAVLSPKSRTEDSEDEKPEADEEAEEEEVSKKKAAKKEKGGKAKGGRRAAAAAAASDNEEEEEDTTAKKKAAKKKEAKKEKKTRGKKKGGEASDEDEDKDSKAPLEEDLEAMTITGKHGRGRRNNKKQQQQQQQQQQQREEDEDHQNVEEEESVETADTAEAEEEEPKIADPMKVSRKDRRKQKKEKKAAQRRRATSSQQNSDQEEDDNTNNNNNNNDDE